MRRDKSIDILRGLALMSILSVHVIVSDLFLGIMNFNVPLIVFISGAVQGMKTNRATTWPEFASFILKRVKRLIIPTWSFLLIWFVAKYLNGSFFSLHTMANMFFLKTSWYVWIIRVFLLLSLMTPLIEFLNTNINWRYILIIDILVLLSFEVAHPEASDNISYYWLMCIPYIPIFTFGYIASKNAESWGWLQAIGILSIVVFGAISLHFYVQRGHYVSNQFYKYPPLLYYTTYGTGISLILWRTRQYVMRICQNLHIDSLLSFIGAHTLTFYFMHIPFVVLLSGVDIDALFKLFLAFSGSLIATLIAVKISHIIGNRCKNEKVSSLVAILLEG